MLKINLKSYTFLDLLEFQEVWNLIAPDKNWATWTYLCRAKQKNLNQFVDPMNI